VRRVAGLTAAALLFAAPASAGDVTLVGPEGRVALSEAAQAELRHIVKREAESCSISSVGYPEIFRGRDAAAEWKAREARPHLHLRYEPPVVMPLGVRGGPSTLATEVLIGIANPKSPEQPLTRHDGVVTMHAKCSGQTALELMCQPALRPYFDKAAADHSCRILEQVRRQN